MLWLLRLAAIAAFVLLIVAQRFAYTIVAEFPAKPGAAGGDAFVSLGAPGPEVDTICPTGIEFTDENRAALIDVDTRRLVEIDVRGRRMASAAPLDLDRSLMPEAIAAEPGALWMWIQDTTGRVHAAAPYTRGPNGNFVAPSGAGRIAPRAAIQERLTRMGFPGATLANAPQRLQAILQRLRERSWSESLTSPNGQVFNVNYVLVSPHRLGIGIENNGKARTETAQSRLDIVSATALAAHDGGDVFVLVTSIDRSVPVLAVHEAVYRIDMSGQKTAIYDIPLEGQDCVARQHVAVSPDGGVYMLRATAERVSLLKIGKRSVFSWLAVPFTRMGHYDPTLGAPLSGLGHLMSANAYEFKDKPASGQMSRRDILHNACLYLNKSWTLTAAHMTGPGFCACDKSNSGCTRWAAAGRLTGHVGESISALPYNWGGADRLEDFEEKIALGRAAGQVCTSSKGGDVVFDSTNAVNNVYTAGVDCSGYVLRAWGWPGSRHDYSTSNLAQIADALPDVLDLRPGDVMNQAGSHVRMILNWRGRDSVEIIESSTWGGGVTRRIMTLASLNSYKPLRGKHVAGDVSALTIDDITCVPGP